MTPFPKENGFSGEWELRSALYLHLLTGVRLAGGLVGTGASRNSANHGPFTSTPGCLRGCQPELEACGTAAKETSVS